MKLNIGDMIKKLRKEREITQEEFAEIIGVSCQSVSRWENNSCYPDIELIPVIAEFFDISTDRLMGVDETKEKNAINSILEAYQKAISSGNIDRCIEIARDGVKKFPNNFVILDKLMYALFLSGDDDGNISEWRENMEKYDSEITALGERIMKYCPDQDIRLSATARLAFNHCLHNRNEIGKRIYATLPPMELCRENQIWHALSKSEKLPFLQKAIMESYQMLRGFIWILADEAELGVESEIAAIKKLFALENLILDGNRPKNNWGAAWLDYDIAKKYATLADYDNMFRHLHLAVDEAKLFDCRPNRQEYNAVLVGKIVENKTDFETADNRPLCEILRNKWLQSKEFDCVRNDNRFKEIINSL